MCMRKFTTTELKRKVEGADAVGTRPMVATYQGQSDDSKSTPRLRYLDRGLQRVLKDGVSFEKPMRKSLRFGSRAMSDKRTRKSAALEDIRRKRSKTHSTHPRPTPGPGDSCRNPLNISDDDEDEEDAEDEEDSIGEGEDVDSWRNDREDLLEVVDPEEEAGAPEENGKRKVAGEETSDIVGEQGSRKGEEQVVIEDYIVEDSDDCIEEKVDPLVTPNAGLIGTIFGKNKERRGGKVQFFPDKLKIEVDRKLLVKIVEEIPYSRIDSLRFCPKAGCVLIELNTNGEGALPERLFPSDMDVQSDMAVLALEDKDVSKAMAGCEQLNGVVTSSCSCNSDNFRRNDKIVHEKIASLLPNRLTDEQQTKARTAKNNSRPIDVDEGGRGSDVILLYPPDTKSIALTRSDVRRLRGGQLLNDTVIDFYLKYMELNVSKIECTKTRGCYDFHFFNTFFWQRLRKDLNGATRWVKKVNLFDKDFVFLPINQAFHWYLAIICFPNNEARSCVLFLDSLETDRNYGSAAALIRRFLKSLNNDRYFKLPMIGCKVPQQENGVDCGVFLLHYIEKWVNAPRRVNSSPHVELDWQDWFDVDEVKKKRDKIKMIIESYRGGQRLGSA